MSKQIDFARYSEFVDAVTSEESRDFVALSDRLVVLAEQGVNIERLLTGAVGLSAESGELMEIVKKLIFQGKPASEETIFHMKREMGDVMWYVMQVLMALDTDIEEIVQMNVEKLQKRYPGGSFDAFYSENRKAGDL
jgi:NTP pyrophosphatase (non-canonical NTP hydrolase)